MNNAIELYEFHINSVECMPCLNHLRFYKMRVMCLEGTMFLCVQEKKLRRVSLLSFLKLHFISAVDFVEDLDRDLQSVQFVAANRSLPSDIQNRDSQDRLSIFFNFDSVFRVV